VRDEAAGWPDRLHGKTNGNMVIAPDNLPQQAGDDRVTTPQRQLHTAMRRTREETVMDSRNAPVASDSDSILKGIDQRTLDTLFSATYEELRHLAGIVRKSDAGATLSPTTLVNEAWLKLSRTPPGAFASELHFKRIAARAMRQILVDAARRKSAARHGGDFLRVTLDDGFQQTSADASELVALEEALQELARINPRHAAMVEARFFGGLDTAETAKMLGVSEATVLRDWRAAKAWLSVELRRS
jgi:RNA polymerase sigma factor (TIGR02999 family)